jgi:mRNA-decapping enzyme subunit 2
VQKIQWYKLSDLPTLKKEKLLQQQAANGEDALKGSSFYMVAPFLGPLRKWIAQQRRQDKAKIRAANPRGIVIEDEDTGAEEQLLSDALPEVTDVEDAAGHMARLLAALQSSKQGKTNLPELSDLGSQAPDPVLELKRLLSVGDEASLNVDANPLLALLHGQSTAPQAQEKMSVSPQSPLGKITNTPPKATTPHHHYPRPPPVPPPLHFPFPPAHGMAPPPQHSHGPKPLPPHHFPLSDGRYGQE